MQTIQYPTHPTQHTSPYLTVREAAHELGISPHTVRAWIAQRRIRYARLGRAIRIPRSEIASILDAALVEARPLWEQHRG